MASNVGFQAAGEAQWLRARELLRGLCANKSKHAVLGPPKLAPPQNHDAHPFLRTGHFSQGHMHKVTTCKTFRKSRGPGRALQNPQMSSKRSPQRPLRTPPRNTFLRRALPRVVLLDGDPLEFRKFWIVQLFENLDIQSLNLHLTNLTRPQCDPLTIHIHM